MNIFKQILITATLLILAFDSLSGESIELKKYARIKSSGSDRTDFTIFQVIPHDLPKNIIFTMRLSRNYSLSSFLQYRGFINEDNQIITLDPFDSIKKNGQVIYDKNPGSPFLLVLPNVVLGEKISFYMNEEGANRHDVRTELVPYPIEISDLSGHQMSINISGQPEHLPFKEHRRYYLLGSGFKPNHILTLKVTYDGYDDEFEYETGVYVSTDGRISEKIINYHLGYPREDYINPLNGIIRVKLSGDGVDLNLEHSTSDFDPDYRPTIKKNPCWIETEDSEDSESFYSFEYFEYSQDDE